MTATDGHVDHDPTQAFPSNAPVRAAKRVNAKPFGQDEKQRLMNRAEALRTMTRQEAFNRDYLTVKDLDDEELRYGRCRDRNGNIPDKGRTVMPQIPRDKFDNMIAEHELRFKERLRQNLDTMLGVMIEVATDDTVEPRDRFEAARYLFERTAGKTPDIVSVTVKSAPYEDLLNSVTGIGSISRAEHRRMRDEGSAAGIIDVDFVDEDAVSGEDIPEDGEDTAFGTMVPVHQARPDEQYAEPQPSTGDSEGCAAEPGAGITDDVRASAPDQAYLADPAKPVDTEAWGRVEVDAPDPYEQYGSRRTEAKSYAQQARDAQDLAARRKEAKDKIKGAKKSRIISRVTGADAIKDEITGATLGEDGKLTFE